MSEKNTLECEIFTKVNIQKSFQNKKKSTKYKYIHLKKEKDK